MNTEEQAIEAFRARFGGEPAVLGRAPGRVELLGNHTDHNSGLVLAVAIDRFTAVAGRATKELSARLYSTHSNAEESFQHNQSIPGKPGSWGQYVRGVFWAMREAWGDYSEGIEASIAGDIPIGAGLSSSASLQAALALFLLRAGVVPEASASLDDDARLTLARVLQRSENVFVEVSSGLLDQFSVLFGRAGEALMLDCRSLAFERLPLGFPSPAIVVCDSKTSRRLADGMYNRRRAECEAVVIHFQKKRGVDAVTTLRDISLDDLDYEWSRLDPTDRLRARHVLTENARVEQGAEALRSGDMARFGRLMSASHASSRDDFANSAPALDFLIEAAETAPGFLGGKLSGAGWAGCTVNLVEAGQAEAFAHSVSESYSRLSDTVPDIHICRAADGASGIVLG